MAIIFPRLKKYGKLDANLAACEFRAVVHQKSEGRLRVGTGMRMV